MVKRTLIFLDRLHWLWLILAAPFLLFPSPKTSPVMLVIPLLFILRWCTIKVRQKEITSNIQVKDHHRLTIIPNTPLNGALLLMSIMVLVSLWATFDINYSLPKISGILLGMGAFLAVAREGVKPRGIIFCIMVFFMIGLAISVLGLFGTSWFSTKMEIFNPIVTRLPRLILGIKGAESGFHPNEVAGGLIWVLPLITALCIILFIRHPKRNIEGIAAKEWQKKVGHFGVTLLCLGATLFIAVVFLLCQSRSGYIGLILTLIILILVAIPPKWRRYSEAFLTLAVIIGGILLISHWDAVRTWILGSNLTADPALSLNTLSGRVEVWSRAIYGIQDFPFTGMGMNAFRKVLPVLYPLFSISPEMDIGHAHNEFLQAGLDLGIPGLIAFIALYIGSFWMLADIWKSSSIPSQDPYDRPVVTRLLALGLAGSLVAHLIFGLTDAVALGAKPGILFWMLLGLVTALHRQKQENLPMNDGNVSSPRHKNKIRI